MRRRVVSSLVALALALAGNAFAGEPTSPAVALVAGDGVVAIGHRAEGGQPMASSDTGVAPFSADFDLYGNDAVFEWLIANVDGKPTPATWDVYSLEKNAARAWTVVDMLPLEIGLPGCDTGAKQAGYARPVGRITFKAKEGATLARRTSKPKTWLSSQFRFRLGDLPTARVRKIDAFSLKLQVADLDGDGLEERYYSARELVLQLPAADAARFREELAATLSGQARTHRAELVYLDDAGQPLLTFTNHYVVDSVGPADVWGDPHVDTDPWTVRLLESIQDEAKGFSSLIR